MLTFLAFPRLFLMIKLIQMTLKSMVFLLNRSGRTALMLTATQMVACAYIIVKIFRSSIEKTSKYWTKPLLVKSNWIEIKNVSSYYATGLPARTMLKPRLILKNWKKSSLTSKRKTPPLSSCQVTLMPDHRSSGAVSWKKTLLAKNLPSLSPSETWNRS